MRNALLSALVFCFVLVPIGCAPRPNAVQQKQAQLVSADKIKSTRANLNPTKHPIKATEDTVRSARTDLLWLAGVSFVVLALAIGLGFTPLSAVSKIAVPLAGAVFGASVLGVLVLPFWPWLLLAVGAAAAGLVIYEWIRLKSFSAVVIDLESGASALLVKGESLVGIRPTPTVQPPAPTSPPKAA